MCDGQHTLFCKCPEAVKLQIELLNHMLQHALKKRLVKRKISNAPPSMPPSVMPSEVVTIDDDDDDDNSFMAEGFTMTEPDSGGISSESEDNVAPLTERDTKAHIEDHPQAVELQPQNFFAKKYSSETHTKGHRKCEKCSQMVPSHRIKTHLRLKHSNEKPYKCELANCKASFRSATALKDHQKIVHSCENAFMCEFCSDRFSSEILLAKHRIRHTEPDKWRCEFCHKNCEDKIKLNRHKRKVHKDQIEIDRPFPCDKCARAFTRARDLNDHTERVHVKGIPEYKYKPPKIEVFCEVIY